MPFPVTFLPLHPPCQEEVVGLSPEEAPLLASYIPGVAQGLLRVTEESPVFDLIGFLHHIYIHPDLVLHMGW